ncbi:uncharacterized protein si:ch73-257c13.2 [Triplophysa dalaica]|uniref:uncharacterized protein si:ch73-257c13.2 n=1 Tax=Triplophysa dalaica TaxID=1582913 RepID=UPI0024DF9B56|nr:uncharacterized protein si:ch73-257c13.2 [Triplophysa dalaica]
MAAGTTESMASKTCVAFLLADCYDDEDLIAETNTAIKRQEARKKEEIKQTQHLKRAGGERGSFNTVLEILTIGDFKSYFRLTPTQTEELVRMMKSYKWTAIKQEGWTVCHAVLSSLWTLSTQESYSGVASRFHVTESVICNQLYEFCYLIASNLENKIHWPQGKEAEVSMKGFYSNVGILGTLCVVGTSNIPIDRPTDVPDAEIYKSGQSFSLKLMAFCNHRGRFTYATAEHPGSWHNSRVLSATEVGKLMQEDPVALLEGKHIIGDCTYPLSEHLLTPFPDYSTLGQKRECYNRRVQSAIKVVQDSIYTLKSSFQRLRCLQKHSYYQTNIAVEACCILYNMFLETCSMPANYREEAVSSKPFHELTYGHSGSLGGISKRQDIAASLKRINKKRKSTY